VVVAVGGPISVEPVVVLVEHGGSDRVQPARVGRRCAPGHLTDDDLGDPPVAELAEVYAVDGQRFFGRLEQLLRGAVQIDVPDAHLLRHRPGRIRVSREACVVVASVREVRVVQVLVCDG
jgi:hypothetical protein